jgi:hypothetical protein
LVFASAIALTFRGLAYSGDPRADQLGNFPCVGSSLHYDLIGRLEALSSEHLDTFPCNGNARAMKLLPSSSIKQASMNCLWISSPTDLGIIISAPLYAGFEPLAIGPSDNYLFELEAQPGES